MTWEMVDAGWGRRAVEFSTLWEPAQCREYLSVHHRLRVGEGDRLLDVACGSGLAMVPQSGHTVNLEEPALFNGLVQDFFHLVEAGKWAIRNSISASLLGSRISDSYLATRRRRASRRRKE